MNTGSFESTNELSDQMAAVFWQMARDNAAELVKDVADDTAREFVRGHLENGIYMALLGIDMDVQCQISGAKQGEYKILYQEPIVR